MRFEASDVKNSKCFCVFLGQPRLVTLKWPRWLFWSVQEVQYPSIIWGWVRPPVITNNEVDLAPFFMLHQNFSSSCRCLSGAFWCSWGTLTIFSHQPVMSSWAIITFLYSRPWEQLHNQVLGQTTMKTIVMLSIEYSLMWITLSVVLTTEGCWLKTFFQFWITMSLLCSKHQYYE